MLPTKDEVGFIPSYCDKIKETAEQVPEGENPFRTELMKYGYDFANMMDCGMKRPEISVLLLELGRSDIDEIEKLQASADLVSQVYEEELKGRNENNKAERIVREAFLGARYQILKESKAYFDRLHSAYNLAHFFANVFTNTRSATQEEWEATVARIMSYDGDHLPDASVGFDSMLNVESVGGIETWTLIRDLVRELYSTEEA